MPEFITGPAVLFAPAGRAEIIPKAASRADMVILDLEDGAGEVDRQIAYSNILNSGLDPARTIVRVVGPGDPHFAEDVAMVRSSPYTLVMVPKISGAVPTGLDGLNVIAMIETPQAVAGIAGIAAHPAVVGLFWGAEDLTHLLGGTHSRYLADEAGEGTYRETMRLTRALMHIHASAHGKFCIDAIHADFHDERGQYLEAVDAARSGFAASACIHPAQVETIRRAYAPEQGQVEWARRVVEKATGYPGAFTLDGQMIDAPLVSQARRIIGRLPA
ncbi:HpcH/HpaI aldolase/citrate lyase family protein [Corynebacterium pacaense]|uniref:HpcH/HpaI aldolase/citrate lyase family protein n=1 Tax=Corynebacterium pacaense TaxID=1816684 RepID=UPI0009BC052F|nr:CoA ester lyase [Corynebacterium pacaense]